MLVRARALALTFLLAAAASLGALPGMRPAVASAAGEKVAIIVGPVGSLTANYRASADKVASAATARGATVVKAYSPNATWANVRAAVNGANVVVYFGHGNGFPNPYSDAENRDRVNGWGLNRTAGNGNGDDWSTTMVYCGEKALRGTLTSADGAAQRQYCSGGPITPAPGFTMIYGQAHYAPGFGERYDEDDPLTKRSEAQQRVRSYSRPVLQLGAAAYIASAYSDANEIVARVLDQPTTTYGDIFRAGDGYSSAHLTATAHPDVSGAEVWVQRTTIEGFHFGDPDYWYAFAGNPNAYPGGSGLPFTDIAGSAFVNEIIWMADQGITTGCTATRFCPTTSVTRGQMASFVARAFALPAASADYFSDDDGLTHEDNINRMAEAGITTGCSETEFCPAGLVSRGQMASFLDRALGLPAATQDFFNDDDGTAHEESINRIAEAGITAGCTATRFCPNGLVNRQQMAAFLYRALVP